MKMKKIINILVWTLFLIGVFIIFSFSENDKNKTICKNLTVNIDEGEGNSFVTTEMVEKIVKNAGYKIGRDPMENINTKTIENKLFDLTSVEEVSVFKQIDGNLKVKLKQRTPIVRIFNKNGRSMYIDDKGKIMSTSPNYTARVIVINGEINEKGTYSVKEIKANDSLAKVSLLDDIFDFVNEFRKDDFFLAQFEQLYIKNGEFIVIPKVGDQKINFGKPVELKQKLKKLKKFYKYGINPNNLNLYKEINLKYNGQIVCTKK